MEEAGEEEVDRRLTVTLEQAEAMEKKKAKKEKGITSPPNLSSLPSLAPAFCSRSNLVQIPPLQPLIHSPAKHRFCLRSFLDAGKAAFGWDIFNQVGSAVCPRAWHAQPGADLAHFLPGFAVQSSQEASREAPAGPGGLRGVQGKNLDAALRPAVFFGLLLGSRCADVVGVCVPG